MSANRNYLLALAAVTVFSTPLSSSALETIFHQDFESGLSANESIVIDVGESGAQIDTRFVSCNIVGDCPFSVHRSGGSVRNFNVHHQSTNPYVGGARDTSDPMKYNPRMSGQVLGHVRDPYDNYEDNIYEVKDIELVEPLEDILLTLDIDSWISDDQDGFAVAIDDGSGWTLLEPTVDSEIQYSDIGVIGDSSLSALTGQSTASGSTIRGFNGWDENGNGINMAGMAIFDISAYADSEISVRFAFTSNGSGEAEGINIDNIKITGVCASGSGPSCVSPPPTGNNEVPAPATLALAAFGLAFARKRKKQPV